MPLRTSVPPDWCHSVGHKAETGKGAISEHYPRDGEVGVNWEFAKGYRLHVYVYIGIRMMGRSGRPMSRHNIPVSHIQRRRKLQNCPTVSGEKRRLSCGQRPNYLDAKENYQIHIIRSMRVKR